MLISSMNFFSVNLIHQNMPIQYFSSKHIHSVTSTPDMGGRGTVGGEAIIPSYNWLINCMAFKN